MFKNTLFLKIILIFTLPALGILYFSSVLVYEKLESSTEVDNINNNLIYLKNLEKLIDSLQKERELSVIYFLQKNKKIELDEIRLVSDEKYKILESLEGKISLEDKFIQLKSKKIELERLRVNIDKFNISLEKIFQEYNEFNSMLLKTFTFLKPIKSDFYFNNEFKNIVDFLNFKEFTQIEKDIVYTSFLNKRINDKLYNIFIKNSLLQDINDDLLTVHKYNSQLNQEYVNKLFTLRNNIINKNFSQSE